MNKFFHKYLFTALVLAWVALDQVTKAILRANLPPGEATGEFWHVRFAHVQNTGSAFGLFLGQTLFLSIVAIAGVIFILVVYRRFVYSVFSTVALALVLGGALGNLVDRLRLGYVTDFIDVRLWDMVYWPAFNVADSGISIGAILLLISVFLSASERGKQDQQPTGTGS